MQTDKPDTAIKGVHYAGTPDLGMSALPDLESLPFPYLSGMIKNEVSLIFGLPGQTVSSFKESIHFTKTLGVPIIHAFPLMLLRGTPLYDKKRAYGLVESTEHVSAKIDRIHQDIPHVVESHSFTYEDWQKMVLIAEQLEEENRLHQKEQENLSMTLRAPIKKTSSRINSCSINI